MLDTFTGCYLARTEALPIQARAVFDALALNWNPMTAAAVGQTTGLETVAVSSQLSRLEKLGYVEAVALSRRGKGRSGFQVVERFFNIWYLMRNGHRRARQRIKFLTVFLQSCFNAPEHTSLGLRLLGVERIYPGYALALARDADSASTPMESEALALVNEGVRLSQLGRSDEAIMVYDSVVSRFGEASELALREEAARAESLKADTLVASGQIVAAEAALRSSIARLPQKAALWNSLGNLLLDAKGDPAAAEMAYLEGLSMAKADDLLALHANCAYVLALHIGNHLRVQEHIQRALAGDLFTTAARELLSALPTSRDADAVEWSAVFSGIGRAVESGDTALWTNYLCDLQRLLWFVIAHKRGDRLREWMIAEAYPLRQAPLYHAVVAAIEGEDHLLQINPETRAPASRIYQGLARQLQIYALESKPARCSGRQRRHSYAPVHG